MMTIQKTNERKRRRNRDASRISVFQRWFGASKVDPYLKIIVRLKQGQEFGVSHPLTGPVACVCSVRRVTIKLMSVIPEVLTYFI